MSRPALTHGGFSYPRAFLRARISLLMKEFAEGNRARD
jgi:hypothetical protein